MSPVDVTNPPKDALRSPSSKKYWFYHKIMHFEEVRAEKQKGHVTKYHLVRCKTIDQKCAAKPSTKMLWITIGENALQNHQ